MEMAEKAIKGGSMTEEKKDMRLGVVTPAANDETYRNCDLIIEAVFEDIELKEQVISASFKMLKSDGIYGSNTSTLPISILAESCPDPTPFTGLHFFSPAAKMKIVTTILLKKPTRQTPPKPPDH